MAAIVSTPLANSTRTPVRTGRESSLEAARRTRCAAERKVLAVDAEGATVIDLRQPREVIGIVGVQRVAAGAAFERQQPGPVAGGEHDLLRRQVAHDVEQQPSRHDDAARLVHVGQELGPDRELHVGGGELDRRLGRLRVDQDARQDLHARALRHAASDHLEVAEKVVLGAGDAHGARSLDGWAANTASVSGGVARHGSSLFSEREPVERSRRVEAVGGCAKYLLTGESRSVWTGDAHPRSLADPRNGPTSLASAWRKRPPVHTPYTSIPAGERRNPQASGP